MCLHFLAGQFGGIGILYPSSTLCKTSVLLIPGYGIRPKPLLVPHIHFLELNELNQNLQFSQRMDVKLKYFLQPNLYE
uniref:Ovule protein n=1 Tax=Meloidogyne incognita TaxID=6306 RepID=A0A914MC68_MELIC